MKPENLPESRETTVRTVNDLFALLENQHAVEHFQTTSQETNLYEEGTLEFGGKRLPYTDAVHDALAAVCKIPMAYENDITFDQFKWNFDQRKFDKACGLTMCVSNGTVVGIGPAHYGHGSAVKGAVKTIDVLNEMEFGNDLWEFESAIISDVGVKINLLIPGAIVEPKIDDVIKIGLEITNSETGGPSLKSPPSLKATMWTLRLDCTNGLTRKTDQTSVYYTKFGRMNYSSKTRAFVRQLEYAKTAVSEEAKKLYEDIIDVPVLDTDLLALHRTIKRRVRGKIDADKVLGILPHERFEIFNCIRNRDKSVASHLTEFLAYDIHNAITATAREAKLPLRQSLEQLGGNVLHMAQQRRHETTGQQVSLN